MAGSRQDERTRLLRRLQTDVQRVREQITYCRDEIARYAAQEQLSTLARDEQAKLRDLRLRAEGLRLELAQLWSEFTTVRYRSPE